MERKSVLTLWFARRIARKWLTKHADNHNRYIHEAIGLKDTTSFVIGLKDIGR